MASSSFGRDDHCITGRLRDTKATGKENSDSSSESEDSIMMFNTSIRARGVTSMIQQMSAYTNSNNDQHLRIDGTGAEVEEMDLHRTAPIFTTEVSTYLEDKNKRNGSSAMPFTQFGLVGMRNTRSTEHSDSQSDAQDHLSSADNLVIANMEAPWSAFICGSQGAGKSHTLSCLLENALLNGGKIGRLPNPLAATVFHYDNYTSASCSQLCEAAYLCSAGIPVTVLVSPSNIWDMTKLYANLPGLPPGSPKPKVLPLYLSEKFLNISTMLKLMAVDLNSDSVPLYMETVMSILREMAMEGKGTNAFSYAEFRSRVDAVQWAPGQLVPLSLRLQLLDSFLEPSKFTKTTRPAPAKEDIWAFKPGTLTVVDLSDPFVNSNDACSLFSIVLSIFLGGTKGGKVVALDEAHKFLLQTGAARNLTADLTSVIRQQRHTGTRVFIATQEPTLSPDLLDLSNVTFIHRFSSPAWYEVLKNHLAGAKKHDSRRGNNSLFETIAALETGEGLMFCPTALVSVASTETGNDKVQKLGSGYMKVKIRKRVTADGGKSVLASESLATVTIMASHDIPMHVVATHQPSTITRASAGAVVAPIPPLRPSTLPLRPASLPPRPATQPPMQSMNTVAPTTTVSEPPKANNQPSASIRAQVKLKAYSLFSTRVQHREWKKLNLEKVRAIGRKIENIYGMQHGTVADDPDLVDVIREEFARCRRDLL